MRDSVYVRACAFRSRRLSLRAREQYSEWKVRNRFRETARQRRSSTSANEHTHTHARKRSECAQSAQQWYELVCVCVLCSLFLFALAWHACKCEARVFVFYLTQMYIMFLPTCCHTLKSSCQHAHACAHANSRSGIEHWLIWAILTKCIRTPAPNHC